MIPKNLDTTTLKMNGQALAHILSFAKQHINLQRRIIEECPMSSSKYDRTIDAIHEQNIKRDYDYYDSLIGKIQGSLKQQGVLCPTG